VAVPRDLKLLARQRIEASIALKQALLRDEQLVDLVVEAGHHLAVALRDGHRLFLFGNGGSAADAQHIAAELVGRFQLERPGLPVHALTLNSSSLTAISNDYSFDMVFARQVEAMGSRGDAVIAISTSGMSRNILAGVEAAGSKGMTSVGLTGRGGGQLKRLVDRCICVPSEETPRVQEAHILIGHLLAEIIEVDLFATGA
jgi:D-sedoheptulose 7-phosphate isomerase